MQNIKYYNYVEIIIGEFKVIYFKYPENWHLFKMRREKDEAIKKPAAVEEQKIKPDEFSISYPVIHSGESADKFKEANNKIVDEVDKLFKSQVLLPEVVDFTDIIGTYDITVNKNQILSVLFGMWTYVRGAAHGFTQYGAVTLNVNTGHVYSFSELFNPKVYYIQTINDLAKDYIRKNNIDLINEYKGIDKNQEYYLTQTSLVLFYQIYRYTPYSYGLFKIEIPYDEIENIISPVGPISRIMRK